MLLNDDRTRLRHIIEAAGEALGYVDGMVRDQFRSSRPRDPERCGDGLALATSSSEFAEVT